MHRITRRSVLVLVVIGALVAGGAAYTNSLGSTTQTNYAGYEQVVVNGATLTDATYGFNNDGSAVDSVTLNFTEDLVGQKLELGLGDNGGNATHVPVTACQPTALAPFDTDTTGTILAAAGAGPTVVTCLLATAVPTSTANQLNVLVTNN